MKIGYGRTSTLDQIAGFEAQKRDLDAAGCERVFSEQLSSVATERPQLDAAINYIRDGDVFVVTKLDRLARSVHDLLAIVKRIEVRKGSLRVLDGAMDTSTAHGRLQLNLLASIAQFEREMMLERQREGIAKAKNDGKYKGRKPTARDKSADVLARLGAGELPADVAAALKISPASVYRIRADAEATAKVV
jgi:DNA invertase Pin-like site-specific DNA recombinase